MTVNFCHNVGIQGVANDLLCRVGIHGEAGSEGQGQSEAENLLHHVSPFPEMQFFGFLFSLYPFSPCNSRRFVLYIRVLKCVERENSGMNSSEKGGRRLKAALEEIRLVRPGAAPERGTA